ncbi:MAG: hypothetical protein ACK5HP_00740 [Bacilli bacterium]
MNRSNLTCKEIYEKFQNLDLKIINLDKSGSPTIDTLLEKFLLGNLKNNNDCLMRLIFNDLALGINNSIDNIINNFEMLKTIIDSSNGKLTLNSILDVIDISKTFLYELQPDEQDITLNSLVKIINSKKYCEGNEEEILFRAKQLHKEHRKKSKSSIPIVSGTFNKIDYKVMNFDDPNLIVSGIDAGNCFRIGGIGEDFLRYCLTSEHAVIINLKDNLNNQYICPVIRNGNSIYGNGIDPEPKTIEEKENIVKALTECFKKIIKCSIPEEKIEFACLTDLHYKDYFYSNSYPLIKIDQHLAINGQFYSDYYKETINNYVLTSYESTPKPKYYIPKVQFFQKRNANYEYRTFEEGDKERIQLFINYINYSSIDCKKISDFQKSENKRNYQSICAADYKYIIGNKDWFIAIDNCMNLLTCLLPYDSRARDEYLKALNEIKKFSFEKGENNIYEESTTRKNN